MRILIFGDSITYGAWDSHGGWADRIKEKIHQSAIDVNADPTKTFQLYNMGISGDTSTGLLSRMEQEVITRKSATRPYVLLISIGTNDTLIDGTNGKLKTSLADYEKNIRELLSIARKYTAKIITVGLPPLPEEEIEFLGMQYNRARLNEYNQSFKNISTELGIPFVDSFQGYLEASDVVALYSADKLHPSDLGHELIAESVWPQLQRALKSD